MIPLNHMNVMAVAGLVAMQNNGHNYFGVGGDSAFTKKERGTPAPIDKPKYEAAPPRPVLPRAERKKILKTKLGDNSQR